MALKAEFQLSTKQRGMGFTWWDRIRKAQYIEKHGALCDLCRRLIALTRKELEERTRGYAVIVDGRIVQVICETCRKRFWIVWVVPEFKPCMHSHQT